MINKTVSTSQKILEYIKEHAQASGNELANYLDITPRAVRKQLKALYEQERIERVGKPPKVFYRVTESGVKTTKISVPDEVRGIIDDRYLYISPTGKELYGWEGFVAWCEKTKQDPKKTAREYIKTTAKYDFFKKKGFIDGKEKLTNTFNEVYVDELFYLDFYSIERFGKTKLGQLLLYAKQSQNKKLIKQLSGEIKNNITTLMSRYEIDGVLFIPPTVRRETQFMSELQKNLQLPVRSLKVTKVKTPIVVPQKTLTKLEDRIVNAEKTIVVEDSGTYSNVLIVDDAVGSGATINQTAKQILTRKICKGKIIGLAITGSFKGFDVISEV